MSMLKQSQDLLRKYAALSRREKILVVLAAAAFVAYVGQALWVAPIYARGEQLRKLTLQQEKELQALQTQLSMLQAQVAVDPNAPLREKLSAGRQRLGDLDQRLRTFESAMVPPDQMSALLGNLLRQVRGVRLLSLRTLPVEPVLAAKTGADGVVVQPKVNMYRHSYELKLEGGYLELAGYLAELERQPQQLLWQRAALSAENYPKSVLTLTFSTLSLDKEWLAL